MYEWNCVKSVKKKECHWFSQRGAGAQSNRGPYCIFGCKEAHWGGCCSVFDTREKRRSFFPEKRLCFNCAKPGHRENKCRASVRQGIIQVCATRLKVQRLSLMGTPLLMMARNHYLPWYLRMSRGGTVGLPWHWLRPQFHIQWSHKESKIATNTTWSSPDIHSEWHKAAIIASVWFTHWAIGWRSDGECWSHRIKATKLYDHQQARYY